MNDADYVEIVDLTASRPRDTARQLIPNVPASTKLGV
jgi:hypothetical protein